MKKKIIIADWGIIDYQAAWDKQMKLFNQIIQCKMAKKDENSATDITPNYLIFCEHPPVYTQGTLGKEAHLLIDEMSLKKQGIAYLRTNRGGDITYHGPGQLVLYPILDLQLFFKDVYLYLRLLEIAVIATLKEFGLLGYTVKGLTGVWIADKNSEQLNKICAIGVRISRWVTMHGLALNITTDLGLFDNIVPCGLSKSSVTSMQKELGFAPNIGKIKKRLAHHLMSQLLVNQESLVTTISKMGFDKINFYNKEK